MYNPILRVNIKGTVKKRAVSPWVLEVKPCKVNCRPHVNRFACSSRLIINPLYDWLESLWKGLFVLLFCRYHGPESVHTAMRYYSDLIYSIVYYKFEWDVFFYFDSQSFWITINYQYSMFFIHSFHLVARAKACVNDYRAALTAEKTAFTIYNSKVGK